MQHGHSPVGLLAFEYTTRYNLTAYIPVHYYNLFLSSIAHIVFRALLGSYINYTMHFCLHTECIRKVNNYTIAYKSNMQLNFRRFFCEYRYHNTRVWKSNLPSKKDWENKKPSIPGMFSLLVSTYLKCPI